MHDVQNVTIVQLISYDISIQLLEVTIFFKTNMILQETPITVWISQPCDMQAEAARSILRARSSEHEKYNARGR